MSADRLARARDVISHFGCGLSAATKVMLVTFGSIVAVLFASLVISIIQFQLRLSEARTQNANITLESIQLLSDHHEYLTQGYQGVRGRAEELNTLRIQYTAEYETLSSLAQSICHQVSAEKADSCLDRVLALVNANHSEIDVIVAEFMSTPSEAQQSAGFRSLTHPLREIVANGSLHRMHQRYRLMQQEVEATCSSLTKISERPGVAGLLGVSPELRVTIQTQCEQAGAASFNKDAVVAPERVRTAGDAAGSRDPLASDASADFRGVNRILLSELVFYYRFYSGLTSGFATLNQLILSPPEFITIVLVIATGILGSFLFHTYTMFSKGPAGYPTFAAMLLRGTLSVMSALIIFILARTGFIAITESAARASGTAISPFAIAFMSVVAGLLAEHALERIRENGLQVLSLRAKAPAAAFEPSSEPEPSNENAQKPTSDPDTPAAARLFGAQRTAVIALALTLFSVGELYAQTPAPRPMDRVAQAVQFGLRCQTPQAWCSLPQPARVGTVCYCKTGGGVAEGRVAP